MKLHEAERKLNEIANIKFKDLFTAGELQTIIVNKGKTGQLLELALGMQLSNTNRDFEDGELKTNKCDETGKPKETIFITQVSSMIDDLLQNIPFEETSLFEKIDNILYVPVCKVGEPAEWSFLESIHVDLNEERFFSLREQLHNDYDTICQLLNHHIETSDDGFIHTSNGKFMQIRSKDSKPYHPIYSNVYGREVSNKNHAFYFKKQFVGEIRRILGL
ncbi:hypothetical protein GMD4S_11401 [Streptococcus sp. GMD4S]|uniref:MutH/Sau3AI family endonuclease n=1 Tax=unclassified Streptococcus TaxID=2608887 RepID=UPI000280DBA3|nr:MULTISPECIES: MutH/Sau3AI family endonuclease [unclassified Streptococcus]EKA01410.1 hypothetical protein GMD6S_10495 [Streptococcus sp. GMD6S]EKA02751.1 hypothetical protein GMD4S_11401 [Streptococcus sp. GMD4S]EKA10113.1 hypothetical protein GMD2S_09489 [Streptococcus sp. GMD2S]EKA13297.1 hypothetical protein GMD1S_09577 [Streptococcus sp. GMD1S]